MFALFAQCLILAVVLIGLVHNLHALLVLIAQTVPFFMNLSNVKKICFAVPNLATLLRQSCATEHVIRNIIMSTIGEAALA